MHHIPAGLFWSKLTVFINLVQILNYFFRFRMVQENRAQMAESPDNLFTGRSIEEIGQIERKIRGDIERKKEELRQMVGERYRPGIYEPGRPPFIHDYR